MQTKVLHGDFVDSLVDVPFWLFVNDCEDIKKYLTHGGTHYSDAVSNNRGLFKVVFNILVIFDDFWAVCS